MKLSKVLLSGVVGTISLGLAACGGGGSEGGGSQTMFKLAFNQTEEHPQYQAGVALGEKLEEATDGRYSIKVYPNEQLGNQADVMQNVSDGTVEMAWTAAAVLEGYNPDFVVFNLPYVFDSMAAQAAVLADREPLAELFDSLEESKSLTVMAGVSAGTRNVYNSKHPIVTPEDLNGLKLRVQQSDSQVAMIEAMGGIASPMSQGEVYSAIQTGVLDGAENNEAVYDGLKHSEVAKYFSYTRHMIVPDYLLMNTDILNAMSDDDRAALLALMPEVQQIANDGLIDYINVSIEHAESIGAQFNDDVDTDAFKELVQPMNEAALAENELRQTLYGYVQEANAANPA
ncbi:TRAP transporter substrate-binding protein [Propionimicrobium sp. PCR01-08-3]|uniref:TRAP transporter substrate-binding protein n=1 Tax=Propionimicrobium sp. PCR01-08-3 TaxID=3052086 RepID=UPI00255C8F88|nr:TRAP transporter substrate-binding protein [Propionimicrobium sp. PCR01-08-3]WIY84029.1 TRAP transporter substrate-binding protein [Propionimicrobium sp. PCR01-08-3]